MSESDHEEKEQTQTKRRKVATPVLTKKKNHLKNVQAFKLAPAPFVLTNEGIKKADTRAKAVQVPADFGWSPQPFFSKSSLMNSHDWIQVNVSHFFLFLWII